MLVSKNAKICLTPNVNAKICVTPNANTLRKQVEYRWCWVPNARGWHGACRFHVVYSGPGGNTACGSLVQRGPGPSVG